MYFYHHFQPIQFNNLYIGKYTLAYFIITKLAYNEHSKYLWSHISIF